MRAATLIVVLATLGMAAAACSERRASRGAGATASGGVTTAPPQPTTSSNLVPPATTASSTGGAAPCTPEPVPPEIGDDWVEDTDWTCTCRFYLPISKAALPPPPSWEPCPISPGGIDCQSMVVDWTAEDWPVALNARFGRDQQGVPLLAIRRKRIDASLPHLVDLITEPDGPVRTAMIELVVEMGSKAGMGCYANIHDLRQGHFILSTAGHNQYGYSGEHRGAIGGLVDDLHPPVLAHYQDGVPLAWRAGGERLVRIRDSGAMDAFRWDMTGELAVASPATDPEGAMLQQATMRDDTLFWNASLLADGINVWTPGGGAKPFIRWVGDGTRGAGDFGTDGIDMVWTYGEGKEAWEWNYPVRSVMTAPYTTDPAAIQARRLRSSPHVGVGGFEWRVGCGYAAGQGAAHDIIVVRLSDGVSWLLPSVPMDLDFYDPLGITCQEVFIYGKIGGRLNIARVQLASLGPGVPPD